jgi:hypothetical protein
MQVSIEKPTVLRQAVNSCEYLLFKKSWVGDYADEENFMSLFYSKNYTPQGVNYFHYNNPEFDKLYDVLKDMPHKLIRNSRNTGFVIATNQGLHLSSAKYVINEEIKTQEVIASEALDENIKQAAQD